MRHALDIQDLTIRMEREEDQRAVIRLAQLDSGWPPAGPRLLALADGTPLAAISLQSGAVIADPFVATAGIVELLRARATQLGLAENGGGLRRRLRGPRSRSAAPQPAGALHPQT